MATLYCRDGYQERIKACATAGPDVDSAFCRFGASALTDCNMGSDVPDPVSYFDALHKTLIGSTFIDAFGGLRVVLWILVPRSNSFSDADVFDPGPGLELSRTG